jgi:hypothetical protein
MRPGYPFRIRGSRSSGSGSPISEEKQEKIRELKKEGVSINQISKKLGVAYEPGTTCKAHALTTSEPE